MGLARIVNNNRLIAPATVITASASATGYPAANLGSWELWRFWRSTTTAGDQWVKFDIGQAFSLQALIAVRVKLHGSGGTLHAQANSTDAWTTPAVNIQLTVPTPDYTRVLAGWMTTPQNLRWVRFYFTNVGTVSDYVELGVAIAGSFFEPKMSLAPGFGMVRRDPSVQRFAIGGQRSAVVRPRFYQVSGTFNLQRSRDRDEFRTIADSNGVSVPVVLAMAPTVDPSLNFYGTMATEQNHNAATANLWDVPFSFTEDVA